LLIPEKKVFRNDELGRYYMIFSKETITELREIANQKGILMSKNLFKDTHDGGIAPSYILDEWQISDENDKAYTEYGFNPQRCPVGTWMVMSQITDNEYWKKEIKLNKKHAYSIEALINLSIIKMQKMAETQKVVLPDGEHLINGTIYVVQGGEVVSTKEVTEQQEEVIETVAEEAIESMAEHTEVKPEEQMSVHTEEPKPVTEMETVEPTPEAPAEEERMSKLESQIGEIVTEIATLRAMLETPAPVEDVEVQMSKSLWRSIAALRSKN